MSNNKKSNIILSVIIAVCLWAYVIGETNPTDSKTFKNIPILLTNGDLLDANGLALLSISSDTTDVTVKGTRVNLSGVRNGDIKAFVNLADAALGKNELKINITVPEKVKIEDKGMNKISVVVERKKSREVGIAARYDGRFEAGKEPLIVEMSRDSVTVSGPESKVESVAYVKAIIKAQDVETNLKSLICPLKAADKNDAEVGRVILSASSVRIITELATVKTVPLEVDVTDTSTDNMLRRVSMPKTVTIKGEAGDIEKVSVIKGEPVDISRITEETSIPIKVILPAGVQISDQSMSLKLTVKMEKMAEKQFNLSSGKIKFSGLGENLKATAAEADIAVTVRGRSKDLDSITEDDIILSADLDGLSEGIHQAKVMVKCDKACRTIEARPDTATVNIEQFEE